MRWTTLLGLLICCAETVPANAQATFGDARDKGSPTVYVIDRSGREVQGRLVTLSESAITIKTDTTTRTFSAGEVSLIERKGDSLRNGMIIGAVVGLVGSTFAVADMCAENRSARRSCAGPAIGVTLIGTGIYAAIGAGIDALIPGRQRIWPVRPTKARIFMFP